jgi:beta-galactosidase
VKTLGKYENISVWNTWQEIGYWAQGLAGQHVCYCENTLQAFRNWLIQKYSDLDGLNQAWHTRYRDWTSVLPDRVASGKNALPNDVDWFYFMDNIQIGHVLQARAKAIRESDPYNRPVFAHLGYSNLGHGVDWTYARSQDFLGSSCYPAWGPFHAWDEDLRSDKAAALIQETWNGVGINYDNIRSANQPGSPVWAAEFQGGRVSNGFHMGRVPAAEDIRRWMLTAVASGITALSFWVTRAEIMAQEANGFSLLNSTGDTTPRLEEAGRVGSALNRHADLFSIPSWAGARIAILVNEENAKYQEAMVNGNGHLAYSTRGWHRLLWELGIPVDFVELTHASLELSSSYKVMVLPFPISISETLAGKLVKYVENGGSLVSEANPGQINVHTEANRGELSPILASLFGVKHASLRMVAEPGGENRFTPKPRTWGEFIEPSLLTGTGILAGLKVRANVHLETFDCQSSQPLLMYGDEVAGVIRQEGAGQAILLGTYIGHNGTAYREEESRNFVKALLKHLGVEPTHDGKLLLRKRIIPGKQAWIFTNPTNQMITEAIEVGKAQVEDLLGLPFEMTGSQVRLSVDSADIRVLIIKNQEEYNAII